MTGKLARYQEQTRRLRATNRELSGVVDDLSARHNPSTLRKFVGVAIQDGTAYGFTRLYVKAMQQGWAPQKVPADLIIGIGGQIATSFFDGPISSVFADMSHGITGGSLGRMATFHQLQKTEVAGAVCLVIPSPVPAPNNNANA